MNEKFKLFWHGPFSQWYMGYFTFNGMSFNCAEQFMMFNKAVFFNDIYTAKSIMITSEPKKQKTLGRQTQNFNVDKWKTVARDIVYVGNYCKFSQDNELKHTLLETNGHTLVEASPYDKIWGIGLSETDPMALQRETWKGENWLGETITMVREDLLSDNKNEDAILFCAELVETFRQSK